jgi:hypothetical protein
MADDIATEPMQQPTYQSQNPRTLEEELIETQHGYKTGALANPLANLSYDRLRELGREFAQKLNLDETYYEVFSKGAVLARKSVIPEEWNLTQPERDALQREGVASLRHAWKQLPPKMRVLIITCGLGAATQGWNESVTHHKSSHWNSLTTSQDSRERRYAF